MAEVLLENIIEISLTMSPIILILLIISGKISKVYRAKWKYWVWLVIFIRLVVPVNISLPNAPVIETGSIRKYQPEVTGYADYNGGAQTAEPHAAEAAKTADIADAPRTNPIYLLKIASMVYISGTALFFFFHIAGYIIFLKKLKRWRIIADSAMITEMFHSLKSEMNIKRNISIYRCSEIDTPMMAGFFHPMILLPSREEFSGRQLEMILRHELVHCRRRDLWYKLLLLIANAIHWFNPFVYIAVRQAAYDMEASCDEAVLQENSAGYRIEYGEAILSVMRGSLKKQTILSTYFSPGRKSMRKRFENILDTGKKHKGTVALVLLAICVIVAGTLIACDKGKEKPDIQVQAYVKDLTENEYSQVGTSGIENPAIDDFKKLCILIDVQSVTNRTISFPSIQDVSNLLTSDIYWYGNSGSQDNESENFAHYWIEAVLYTRNTSFEEIRSKLGNLKIDVSYKDEQGKAKQGTYNLGDLLTSDREAEITMDDVRELARKGDALTFEDFKPFSGADASSTLNYHIMVYGVEGGYRLIVRTDGIHLDNVDFESIWESSGSGIDIRYNDVDEFIKSHPSSEAN